MSNLTRLRSPRILLTLVCLVALGVVLVFLPSLLANPAEDPGGGPADASVLPFDEATFKPVVTMAVPAGDPCSWLTDTEISGIAGQPLSPAEHSDGCTWSGGGMRIQVTASDQPLTAAFPDLAEDWPDYPEVVTDPVNGLFFLEGPEAALLLDAGESTVVIHATQAGGEHRQLLDMLITVAEALTG